MSTLAVDAGSDGVTALVLGDDAQVLATSTAVVEVSVPRPGWVELAPDQVWRAVLEAVRAVLAETDPSDLVAIGVTTERDTTVLWDVETLGSPRPALAGADRRTTGGGLAARLAWVAASEPHTWALVEAGRYAVGTLDSYLVARMTRGTWHVTDVSHACGTGLLELDGATWSSSRCREAGVPPDALAELVPTWGGVAVTEPRTFVGLELPVTAVVARPSATMVALGCLDEGCALLTLDAAPTLLAPGTGDALAWRSPTGVVTHALETSVLDLAHLPVLPSRVLVVGPRADDAACQAVADELGATLEQAPPRATAAVGAALLAGLGAERAPADLAVAREPGRVFTPR